MAKIGKVNWSLVPMARQRELFDFVMYGPVLENYRGNLCVRWCTPDGIPLDSSEIVHPGATAAGKDVVAWYKRTECGRLREKIVVKPGQPLRAEFWLDGVLPKPADGARSNPLIITGGKRSTAVNFQLEFGLKNRTLGFMHMSSGEVTVCVHREGRVWKRSFVMILPVNAPSEPGDYLAYACARSKAVTSPIDAVSSPGGSVLKELRESENRKTCTSIVLAVLTSCDVTRLWERHGICQK